DDDDTPPDAQPDEWSDGDFKSRAAVIYSQYETHFKRRFRWLAASRFADQFPKDLRGDNKILLDVLKKCGKWDSQRDAKLETLVSLLTKKHRNEKVLVFTQFADTVDYLAEQLRARGLTGFGAVTGDSENPTKLAWQFSPVSNHKRIDVSTADEFRV